MRAEQPVEYSNLPLQHPHAKIRAMPLRKPRSPRHPVTQPNDQSIKLIPLTKGHTAIVDATDYDWLNQWNWTVFETRGLFYAYRKCMKRQIFMHRFIFDAKESEDVDHKDHDGLNNRRNNLRSCVQAQNGCNRGAPKTNTSGFKGVCFNKEAGKWQANIQSNKKQNHLGLYATREDAARAYDAAARELHGEFAFQNFPH